MNKSNIDNDLTESINNEKNQTDSLDETVETEPTVSPNDPDTPESDHSEEDAGSAEDGLQKDQPAKSPSPESETFLDVIKRSEPMTEFLNYIGMDTTAVIDIAITEVEDESDTTVADWISKVEKPKDGQKLDKDSLIQDGIETQRFKKVLDW